MSFSGGTFSINTPGQPVPTGAPIFAGAFNALTADLATGLSTCMLKDGTQTITANIPMSSFKFTGLAAGTTAGDSLRYEQLYSAAITPASINFGQTTLSYYGEGTWTPTDVSGASLTFSSAIGTYTRIGRMFMAGFSITYPATASGANADVGSLPFTTANSASARTGFMSFSATASQIVYLAPSANATDFLFINAAGAIVTNANLSGTSIRGAVMSYV